MNAYLGDRGGPFSGGYWQFRKYSHIANPAPSKTWVFVDEREYSINDGWFAVDMDSYDPLRSSGHRIVDCPASYHNMAAGFAFADGHAEIKKWVDIRTAPRLRKGQPLALGVSSPNNKDVDWMQERTSSKMVNSTRF